MKKWVGEKRAEVIRRGRLGERFQVIGADLGETACATEAAWDNHATPEDRAARWLVTSHRKWTAKQIREIIRLHVQGVPRLEVAQRFGVSVKIISDLWQLRATEADKEARVQALADAAAARRLVKPDFDGPVFAQHNVTTKDYGRISPATDPRYSLTPASVA